MKKYSLFVLLFFTFLTGCKKKNLVATNSRTFKMGFSTWSYGPTTADRNSTYDLIQQNGDIYVEQIDDKIPWNAWINNTPLPAEFEHDIADRVSRKTTHHKMVLAISPLNANRNDFIEDMDGSGTPVYDSMNDAPIEEAYFKHVDYLITAFQPDYLILAMETNDLLLHAPDKWHGFNLLTDQVRIRLKNKYPNLPLSESVTLHNWYQPETADPDTYQNQIKNRIQSFDFAAISFYPFFNGMHNKNDFQKAFDFLHQQVSIPIAFVETCHLAENLIVPAYGIDIPSDPNEQAAYLSTLLTNANNKDYAFIIWWTIRDYDALWNTFPESVKDLGKLWRDTGLQDENGKNRIAFDLWQSVFSP